MTEIQTFQRPTTALTQQGTGQSPATLQATEVTKSITDWASELHAAGEIAQILAGTEFVPQGLRGNAEAVAAAILTGYEIGLKPMNALANIFVVRGRPAMYARTMVSLALSHGHQVERAAATEQTVTVRGKRAGSTSWQEFTWTIDRANRAGYSGNQKYKTDPIAMLTAKAQAECCRTMFPDVLSGMAASVEEIDLGDYEDQPTTTQREVKSAPRKLQRKAPAKAPVKAPEPVAPPVVQDAPQDEEEPEEDVDQTTGEVAEPEAPVEYIAKVDQGRISNLLEGLGITDRGEKLAFVRAQVGDESLRGVNGLTVEQGRAVISYLEAQPEYEQSEQD